MRTRLLRKYGDFSLAYSTAVQPLLRHLGDEHGYLAYRRRYGVALALGDPVVAEKGKADLLRKFADRFRSPVFCQVSRSTAELLDQMGFYVNELGLDTAIDLSRYTFDGKEKEWLRYAWNWMNRRGYQFVESDFGSGQPVPIDTDRVEAISEAWRQTRTVKRKEVRFLNRPIILEAERDVRRFFLLDRDGKIQTYIFLDPLYQGEQVTGYVTTFKRRHPDAPQYSEQALMKFIIESLKAEGVPRLMLGLSPLADLAKGDFRSSPVTQFLFQRTFDSRLVNRFFYHVQGHAAYKRRFRGREEKVYLATRQKFTLRHMCALVGLSGIA